MCWSDTRLIHYSNQVCRVRRLFGIHLKKESQKNKKRGCISKRLREERSSTLALRQAEGREYTRIWKFFFLIGRCRASKPIRAAWSHDLSMERHLLCCRATRPEASKNTWCILPRLRSVRA